MVLLLPIYNPIVKMVGTLEVLGTSRRHRNGLAKGGSKAQVPHKVRFCSALGHTEEIFIWFYRQR
jgi:hypothetical protein